MYKLFLILFSAICTDIYCAKLGEFNLSSDKQYLYYKSDSVITEYYKSRNNFSLFNDNVNFSTSAHTYNSLLKMWGEALSGGVLGFALGTFMYNTFETKEKEENFIGEPIQLIFTSIGVIAGVTCGVYGLGKLLGDDGETKNIIGWMAITGAVTSVIINIISSDENSRIWIPLASLPLGAAFGFNTNDISDWISLSNK